MKTFGAAFTQEVDDALRAHLLKDITREDLCFALWKPSAGRTRDSALVYEVILPQSGDRNLHGNASFNSAFFERALRLAADRGSGLAFLHNHLTGGWQGLSRDDYFAEEKISPSVQATTGQPLVGLTVGTDGAWSARRWTKKDRRIYEPQWAQSVRVIGDGLGVTLCDQLLSPPRFREELRRTRSAWGDANQSKIVRLHVGVVGLGSVGGIVAEAFAMMGVRKITLLDFDEFKTLNRDRSLGVGPQDVGKAKVEVVARRLRACATADDFEVLPFEFSVVENVGFRAALDCDILFSCVDRPWPRSVLNVIAMAHLIPVVDGGIKVRQGASGFMRSADWRAHVVTPGRRCMECLGQFDPGQVSLERDGYLDQPSYIEGLPLGHDLRGSENVFGFSLSVASMEVLQALSLIVQPSGVGNIGAQFYHFVPGTLSSTIEGCAETCLYKALAARGDTIDFKCESRHPAAEEARSRRQGTATRSEEVDLMGRAWRWGRRLMARRL